MMIGTNNTQNFYGQSRIATGFINKKTQDVQLQAFDPRSGKYFQFETNLKDGKETSQIRFFKEVTDKNGQKKQISYLLDPKSASAARITKQMMGILSEGGNSGRFGYQTVGESKDNAGNILSKFAVLDYEAPQPDTTPDQTTSFVRPQTPTSTMTLGGK
ncbi:MAG: hypothetical protein ACKO37_06835 [Vampirovibrionales bacterium]